MRYSVGYKKNLHFTYLLKIYIAILKSHLTTELLL